MIKIVEAMPVVVVVVGLPTITVVVVVMGQLQQHHQQTHMSGVKKFSRLKMLCLYLGAASDAQ